MDSLREIWESLTDLWHFMLRRKKWWLLPIVIILILLTFVILLGGQSGLAPFIYTLF
jgi:hypothetical protein